MQYSSLQKKHCKCSPDCTLWPDISFEGFSRLHAPQEVLDRLEVKQKRKNAVKKDLTKLRVVEVESDDNRSLAKNYGALNRWFKERRKEMTGKCHHCNGNSCKHDDKYYKFSICHILPKAYFPSVATHEYNWVELCFWNKNCHGNMDNKMLDLIEMNCWDEIVTKFCIMYPSIAEKEKKRIPQVLLQYIEVEK